MALDNSILTLLGMPNGQYDPIKYGQQAEPPSAGPDLTALLGSQPQITQGADITVTAPPSRNSPIYQATEVADSPVQVQNAQPDMSQMPRTSASPQELASTQNYSNLPEHKGFLGVKGTLRDILGTVGDALLQANGRQAIYAPTRQREQLSDAYVGYGRGDVNADLAAIQRVARVNPQMAQQMLQQTQQNQARQQQIQATQQTRTNAQTLQKAKLVPNLLAAAKGDPVQQQAIMAWYKDPNSSIEDIDPDTLAGAAINPYQQGQLNLGDRRLDQQRDIATMQEQGRNTRYQPRSQPRQRSQTDLEYFQQIGSKPSSQRTQAENDFYKKYTQGTGRGNRIIDKYSGGSTATPQTQAQSGTPKVGYVNSYGLRFMGGDPNDRRNWK